MRSTEPAPLLGLTRGRRASYLALTALWYVLVIAGLAESFLQLRWTPPAAESHEAFGGHPLYTTGPLPGAQGMHVRTEYRKPFEINRLGFRGPLPELTTPATKPRLLVVGDSQTFGFGCGEGETFCDRLREELPGVDVLNAGSNGYGTREQLAVVHHLGEVWRPDVILVMHFWNDLEDNVKRSVPDFGLDPDGHVTRLDPHDAGFDPLALREPVEAYLPNITGPLLPRFFKEGLRGVRYRTLGVKKRKIRTQEQKDEAWEVTEELMELMKLRADELGARLYFACIPDHNQVDPSAVIRNIGPLNFDVQEHLYDVCNRLDIPTIDLLPDLSAGHLETSDPLYYYADRHLTPIGHGIVGHTLATALAQELGASESIER